MLAFVAQDQIGDFLNTQSKRVMSSSYVRIFAPIGCSRSLCNDLNLRVRKQAIDLRTDYRLGIQFTSDGPWDPLRVSLEPHRSKEEEEMDASDLVISDLVFPDSVNELI